MFAPPINHPPPKWWEKLWIVKKYRQFKRRNMWKQVTLPRITNFDEHEKPLTELLTSVLPMTEPVEGLFTITFVTPVPFETLKDVLEWMEYRKKTKFVVEEQLTKKTYFLHENCVYENYVMLVPFEGKCNDNVRRKVNFVDLFNKYELVPDSRWGGSTKLGKTIKL